MNKLTLAIKNKGWTLREFLESINRTDDWFYKHSNGGKDFDLLTYAIKGIEDKL